MTYSDKDLNNSDEMEENRAMKTEQLFIHKFKYLFKENIKETYEDEKGYFIKIDGDWKKLTLTDHESPIKN